MAFIPPINKEKLEYLRVDRTHCLDAAYGPFCAFKYFAHMKSICVNMYIILHVVYLSCVYVIADPDRC